MEHPFQLSDTSAISFAIYNDCSFGAYIDHDKNGIEITRESLDYESQHNVRARKIGLDSILFSYRRGAFDFGDQNHFKVSPWTPAGITRLIVNELPFSFWEDHSLVYESYHYVHLLGIGKTSPWSLYSKSHFENRNSTTVMIKSQ